MPIECDVLVVGGGPAGCSAAAAAAKQGMDTVLIEEDEEIGRPVKCAEGIGSYLFPLMPFKIPDRLLKWKIEGMHFHTEDISVKRKGNLWKGWSIDRSEWDKWLAGKASSNGAKIMTGTRLTSVDKKDKYRITDAYAERGDETLQFKPKYLIAADGPSSTVAKLLGIHMENLVNAHIIGYEVEGKIKDSEFEYVFFGEFAPHGYGYVFPKSQKKANVGVGEFNKAEEEMRKKFEKFIDSEKVKNVIDIKRRNSEKSGEAPIYYPDFKWNHDNVFFVGDAANHPIKPFEEGILPAVICGWILGKNLNKFYENKKDYKRYIEDFFDLAYSESEDIEKSLKFFKPERSIALFSGLISGSELSKKSDRECLERANKWNDSWLFRLKENLIANIHFMFFRLKLYFKRLKM